MREKDFKGFYSIIKGRSVS